MSSDQLFAEERKKKILDLLNNSGHIIVNQLAEKFEVSKATIRRDLQELEDRNLLVRSHGGAVPKETTNYEPSLKEKLNKYADQKDEIGKFAASLINEGDTIFLDAGSTTIMIIPHLKVKRLTIVTNSLSIVQKISIDSPYTLICLGGQLKQTTQAFVGPLAENMLQTLHVDKAFVGSNGIDLKFGITTPDPVEANLKSLMIRSANEAYIVSDYSKFHHTTFAKIADIGDITAIIVDSSIPQSDVEEFEQNGGKILRNDLNRNNQQQKRGKN
jgi:DeoR family transcriptional regulator, fructose operon transcriptional repressor